MMADGPFPAHYEPFEAPVANPIFPKVRGNPAARVFDGDFEVFGDAAEFPIVATTYRLTEHFHYWTKNVQINAVLQPEFFVELSEQLAPGEGHQARPDGAGLVEPRRGEGGGDGHQAAEAADRSTARPCIPSASRCTSASSAGTKKASPVELADAAGRRRQRRRRRSSRRSSSTSSPSPGRWHREVAHVPTDPEPHHRAGPAEIRRGRPLPPLGLDHHPPARTADRGRQADRRLEVHRLQGLPGGLPRVERDDRGDRHQHRGHREPAGPDRRTASR